MLHHGNTVQLDRETLDEYVAYLGKTEADLSRSLSDEGVFLSSDRSAELAELVRQGRTCAELRTGEHPAHVHAGLIHDWVGTTRIPGATIGNTLALVQNYDRHKEIYRPEVIDSKLVSRCGNIFEIYLRLLKKKVITVVLDTDHRVEYGSLSATRSWCRSHTTRISEIEPSVPI